MLAGAALALAVSIGLFAGSWPGNQPAIVVSPQAMEPAPIAESDVELYIDVYTEMQRNHDLSIEDAVVEHGVTVPQFREIERRIQSEAPVIKRVRDALLEQAKSHAASLAFPAPAHE